MKFRWVPWYKATFDIEETRVEFLERVKKAVDDDYIGYVDDNGFRIFFRRFLGRLSFIHIKEFQTSYSTILWCGVQQNKKHLKITVYISLYWLAYLILLPLFIIPIVESITNGEPLFLLFSLAVYFFAILFYNLRAHVLYNFFLKILHNKLNLY